MKRLFQKTFLLLGIISIIIAASSLPVLAASCADDPNKICLENPLVANNPAQLIGVVINTFLGLSGSIALIVFIIGGITWLTSEGAAPKIKKGMDTMIWAAIGMAVIFGSAALVKFIIERLVAK